MGLPVRTAAPDRPPFNQPPLAVSRHIWQSQTGRVWVLVLITDRTHLGRLNRATVGAVGAGDLQLKETKR